MISCAIAALTQMVLGSTMQSLLVWFICLYSYATVSSLLISFPKTVWMGSKRFDHSQSRLTSAVQNTPRRHISISAGSNNNGDNNARNYYEEISIIIDQEKNKPLKDFNSNLPSLLKDHSHILTKDHWYEQVMDHKLRNETDNETALARLRAIDDSLRAFVTQERKIRARLKVQYLIAGAMTERFNEAVNMLSESGEINTELMICIDDLITRELYKSTGPRLDPNEPDDGNKEEEYDYDIYDDGDAAALKSRAFALQQRKLVDSQRVNEDRSSSLSSLSSLFSSSSVALGRTEHEQRTIEVLQMIRKRLDVELHKDLYPNVRLLSDLLSIEDPAARLAVLKEQLKTLDKISDFVAFLKEGIEQLEEKVQRLQNYQQDAYSFIFGNNTSSAGSTDVGKESSATTSKTVSSSDLPPPPPRATSTTIVEGGVKVGTVEKMRDILHDIEVRLLPDQGEGSSSDSSIVGGSSPSPSSTSSPSPPTSPPSTYADSYSYTYSSSSSSSVVEGDL